MQWYDILKDVAGFIGILLAFVFYFKGKREKKPYWSIHTVNLFKDHAGTVDGLDVQYLGSKVKNLSISNIMFWNRGGVTIDQSDITEADPLRVEFQGEGRILSAAVLALNNQAIRPSLSMPTEKCALTRFDYLDRGQGFVIRVIHEGLSSADLHVKGSLKGVPKIKRFYMGLVPDRKWEWTSGLFLLPLPIAVYGKLYVFPNLLPKPPDLAVDILIYPSVLLASIVIIPHFYSWYIHLKWLPPGLGSFLADPMEKENEDS